MARAMATGSWASASAVFMRMPSTPCSIVRQASDAVPTPASTITGTWSRLREQAPTDGRAVPEPITAGLGLLSLGGLSLHLLRRR